MPAQVSNVAVPEPTFTEPVMPEPAPMDVTLDTIGNSQSANKKFVSLPLLTSLANPATPLEESSVRRSSRLSQNKDGFQHYQLEDHPRK